MAKDTLKTLRLGVERVREGKAQTCRNEFEQLASPMTWSCWANLFQSTSV